MASAEFLRKRVEGKQKEIEKLQKKLERIQKAKATGWEVNPYYYDDSDLKWCIRDLEEAKELLTKYEEQLKEAEDKAASRNVKAIIDFLEMWKREVHNYYMKAITEHSEESKKVGDLYAKMYECTYGSDEFKQAKKEYDEANALYEKHRCGTFETVTYTNAFGREIKARKKVSDGKYEFASRYLHTRNLAEAEQLLNKDLQQDANAKYDDIVERTCCIVGQITDASGLECNDKGNLDGYIIGTKGRARVETIGAGGYNIQCFHFRTLIHKA